MMTLQMLMYAYMESDLIEIYRLKVSSSSSLQSTAESGQQEEKSRAAKELRRR